MGLVMKLWELSEMIAAVCPVDGINSDGVIFYKPEVTPTQQSAAEALMVAHIASVDTSQ
jgi:hypothetical protein